MPTPEELYIELHKELQHNIADIKARNARVEADKDWETSWLRRGLVTVLTYLVIVIFFFVASLPNPFVNAIVPATAFLVSNLSIGLVKRWWVTKRRV